MIDIKLIQEQPELIKENNRKRGVDVDVDAIVVLAEKRADLITQLQEERAKGNDIASKIPQASDEERQGLIEEGRASKERAKEMEGHVAEVENELKRLTWKLPNILLDDVVVGKDESENVVDRKWGEPTEFAFEPKDHVELGSTLDIIDLERAAKVTGARFYYLKGDGALLEMALTQFVVQTLTSPEKMKEIAEQVEPGYNATPFVPIMVPVMIRPEMYERMGRLTEEDKDERYHLPKDDVYLIGSAEHTLGPMHADEMLDETQLPLRYLGFSTSFRREAGSYGKDTRGILRVHQFDKLEMESFTVPEMSEKEQRLMVAVQEYLMQQLGIPYQVVNICTGDMGSPDARQIDIEAWMPGQGAYRETHTSDLMTDYQARRLNIRVKREDGRKEIVHMNDATACAMTRMLIAVIENNQQADGTVVVPEVLRPWMGKDRITK